MHLRLERSRLHQLAPLSDEEVARRVVAGDIGAFELLMRRHNQRLYRVARAILSNDADAEDALQEAYIRIYEGLSAFGERARLVTWMTRIVFNEAVRFRQHRAAVRRRERGLEALLHDGMDREADGRAARRKGGGAIGDSGAVAAEPIVPRTEGAQMIDDAMAGLSDQERSVVVLRLVQGLSTRETAISLGISESNVKISLFRARPKMAAAFEKAGLEEIRRQSVFDGERCDRLVAAVFARLARGAE